MIAEAVKEPEDRRPRKRPRTDGGGTLKAPSSEVSVSTSSTADPTVEDDDPAVLRRRLSSLLRRLGRSDEHVKAALNAVALVDQREELERERRELALRPPTGRGGDAAITAAAAAMVNELQRVDGFLAAMSSVARGAPAMHVAAAAGIEVPQTPSRGAGGPTVGCLPLQQKRTVPGTLAAAALSFVPPEPGTQRLGEVAFNPVLQNEMEKWAIPPKDCCVECGGSKRRFPSGWEFPIQLSFAEMLNLYLLGKMPDGGKLAIGPLAKLRGSDFTNVPKGGKIFHDMKDLMNSVAEVGNAKGVWKGEINTRARKGPPGSERDWSEEEVEDLYNGVKSHFLVHKDIIIIKREHKKRRLGILSWQTILRYENQRRAKARKRALRGQ